MEQPDALVVVRVGHNGIDHSVVGLRSVLADEEEQRRELLAAHERELLMRFLLGEVGGHLRARLREARELIDDMNVQLKVPTASGMTIQLRWEPSGSSDDGTKEALELLRRDVQLLSDDNQDALTSFFQRPDRQCARRHGRRELARSPRRGARLPPLAPSTASSVRQDGRTVTS